MFTSVVVEKHASVTDITWLVQRWFTCLEGRWKTYYTKTSSASQSTLLGNETKSIKAFSAYFLFLNLLYRKIQVKNVFILKKLSKPVKVDCNNFKNKITYDTCTLVCNILQIILFVSFLNTTMSNVLCLILI